MEHGKILRTHLEQGLLDKANLMDFLKIYHVTSRLVYRTVSKPLLHNSPRILPSFDDHHPLRVKEKSKNRLKMGYTRNSRRWTSAIIDCPRRHAARKRQESRRGRGRCGSSSRSHDAAVILNEVHASGPPTSWSWLIIYTSISVVLDVPTSWLSRHFIG